MPHIVRITTLIENRACGALACEHGLSLWIEYGSARYLLDAGASSLFAANAGALGIDLSSADAAVLSHAHYDHSGGFAAFFARNAHAKVYLQKAARLGCYAEKQGGRTYIGIPQGLLERYAGRFAFVSGKTALADGVWLLPHTTPGLERKGRAVNLFLRSAAGVRPDDFSHEQSLVLDTPHGLVICNSCCHAGADIVAKEALQAFPGRSVLALIGGFHLMGPEGAETMGPPAQAVRDLARRLVSLGVQHIYTGHCTGAPAYEILQAAMQGRAHYLVTGGAITF